MRDSVHSATDEDRAAAQPQLFRIGTAELDLAARQLRFDGETVDVQPKVFDLLAYLVVHRDRVVSKDELFDRVWPTVVVSDASLSQTVKRARDLFRNQGFTRDIIRTVARRGYQFDHDVVVGTPASQGQPAAAPPPARRTPNVPLLATTLMALTALIILWPPGREPAAPEAAPTAAPVQVAAGSVAVLPFANLTPDSDFVYFTDGLTETLINNLATVPGLRVIARTSAYSASRSASEPSVIAAGLGVAHLLQGSVQRDGDTLRISARLIRAADGAQLWSHQYSRLLDDIFAVQDAIARSVVLELGRVLDTDLTAPRPVGIAETAATARAYRLALRAARARRQGSKESVREAEALFREALTVAPDLSPALVGLSEAVRWRGVTGSLPRDAAFREALTLVERAVRLAPDNALAHLQLAELRHRHFWDFAGAETSYREALELMPGSADIYAAYSRFLAKAGDARAAVESAREAAAMNPRSSNVQTNLVLRLIKDNELDAARRAIEDLRRLNREHIDLAWLESNWHLRRGSDREALQWITLEELDHLRLSLSAVALYRLERTSQAEAAVAELIEKDAAGSAFQIAEVYAQWGDADQAFAWLERALQGGDPGLIELYSSLNLENLYADPRFSALAGRIGLPSAPLGIQRS